MDESSYSAGADFPELLAARLREALPPDTVRARFAPTLSYGRHFGPAAHDARPAAVTILVYPRADGWYVPFTVRPDTMLSHAGQISFPGGMVEAGESTRDAALRELEEELGVHPAAVEVLGCLSPLYVFVSNFQVTPWVAVTREPVEFHPCRHEVAEVLETSLSHLMDASNAGIHRYNRGELDFTAPHFSWGTHRIWGATSMILAELLAVVADLPAEALEFKAPTAQ